MGIIYSLCCANHREILDIGKPHPGGEARPIAPDLVDVLRREHRNWEDTPKGKAQLDRLLALIAAFMQRHHGCYVVVGADRGDAWQKRAASSGHPWISFSVYEDGPTYEAEFGKRKRIEDRILREELIDRKVRYYRAVGEDDKVALLDEHGDLDVLQYIQTRPLRTPVTDEKAVGLCVDCGGHGTCRMCLGHGVYMLSDECLLCKGGGACGRCGGTGLVERTEQ